MSAMPWLRRSVIVLLILLLIAIIGACIWAGSEIAAPARRPLQDYHREFLADPAAHGVVVRPFTLTDGTPCLLVEPEPSGRLGARGAKIREQLTAQNFKLSAPGQTQGTLVLVHGRKGRKEDYLIIAERLCAAGFRCLLPDMPAHGDHPGTLATYGINESLIPARALAEAAQKFSFPPAPAGLMGMSMGGAVAMRAASGVVVWKALVIVSSFDTLESAIEKNVSDRVGGLWCLGAGRVYQWKSGHPLATLRSDQAAADVTMPTLMAHGTSDQVIPIESGRRLFAALPASLEKQWVEVPGAGHDNVLITDFPIYATIAGWMLRHLQ